MVLIGANKCSALGSILEYIHNSTADEEPNHGRITASLSCAVYWLSGSVGVAIGGYAHGGFGVVIHKVEY